VTRFRIFLAPDGKIGNGRTGKNPMVYVIGGFSTVRRILYCSTSRNPIWIARWMPQNLFWGG